MRKMLQDNARRDREISPVVQPVELVLDTKYIAKITEFVKDSKSELRICAYAWRWYDKEPEIGIQKFNIELLKAARRGVKVRALVDNFAMWKEIRQYGLECRYVMPAKLLHTKAVCVDHKTLIIGSHNLTKNATENNFEASVAIQDDSTIEQFTKYFDVMWSVANAC